MRTSHSLIALACAALIAACGDTHGSDEATPDAGAPQSDAGLGGDIVEGSGDGSGESSSRPGGGGVVVDAPSAGAPTLIARSFLFVRESGGVSEGFDLDGRDSSQADAQGCRQADFTHPDGTEGIDNQLGVLLPLIEAAGGEALEYLIQDAVNEGDLLIVLQFDGLDSRENDDDVTLSLRRAVGDPLVGTDGLIEPFQSFDLDFDEPTSTFEGARVVDGVLEAGPFLARLPIFVFDFRFEVDLIDAIVRVEFGDDGVVRATIGGTVTLANVLDIADTPGIQDRIADLVATVGATMTDSTVEEECDAFSVATTLEFIDAFIYADTETRPAEGSGDVPPPRTGNEDEEEG